MIRRLAILAAIALSMAACGKDKTPEKIPGYGPGKQEQARYCKDNHWRYDAKTNSCIR